MIGRIVEIAEDNRHLLAQRGFMIIQDSHANDAELGRVPLDDIATVIAHGHGLTYTNNLLVALAERGTPFVLCGVNHNPVAMLWPVEGNFQQAKRFDAQISANLPMRKRLWAHIVRAKLTQQATTLEAIGAPSPPLSTLAKKVRSGDPDNLEAQGARRYWHLMFGAGFRRDQNEEGVNSLLNYGYTILRAAMARAVIGAGLHPTIGLHHANEGNAMRLVDDLMEPFRPLVDLQVWHLHRQGQVTINSDSKRDLVHILYDEMETSSGTTPVMVCMQRLAISLVQILLGERETLDLPRPGLPLTISTGLHGHDTRCSVVTV